MSRPPTPRFVARKTWVPGTRPGMTTESSCVNLIGTCSNPSQSIDLRHHLGAEQVDRLQRLIARQGAEEQIGQEIVDAELASLLLDCGPHGRRAAGDHQAL